MTPTPKPTKGSPAKVAQGLVAQADALAALNNVVDATKQYLAEREQHVSKRAELSAYTALETERIRAAERVLSGYFKQVFDERSSNFDSLWHRLDQAAEAGDTDGVTEALDAVLALAQQSPLTGVKDLAEVRKALNDPDKTWEL